jgi:hypothetical protein
MKFNLKTFPRRKKETVTDPISGCKIESIIIPSIEDYKAWAEGFEKELRELLRNYGGGLILNEFIREILGESKE